MNKLFFFFLLFCPNFIVAQYLVEGKVMDTTNQVLPSASIVVLQKLDSTLVNFGLSNSKGEFQIGLSEKGNYLLQCSFLGYKSVIIPIETSWEQKKVSLAPIKMEPSDFQLSEVNVIAERIPLQLKGDTLIYDAAAFKTRTGDDVETLLELFPGISIDSEGNLIAQGKKVDKVLVNGKEFFGKNIETATKNLDALMVEKVEVFDKKSENAEFTGINDGNEKRTINLELKEEYKKGSFGKLEAAVGNEKTYSGRVNYNRFNPTTQSSVIGNSNNVNQGSYQSVTDINSNSGGQGITEILNGGLNISHEFSSRLKTNFNYTLQDNNTAVESEVLSQNFTDSAKFETRQSSENETKRSEHRFNNNLKWEINDQMETNIRTNFGWAGQSSLNASSTLYDPPLNGSLVESNTKQTDDQINFSTNLDVRKRFAKKGRSWLNQFSLDHTEKQEETNLFNTTFGEPLNQIQRFEEKGISSEINSTYTEPINEKWFVKVSYAYRTEKNEPTRSFFDLENSSLNFNDSLSSSFQRILNSHDVELSINRNTEKLTSSAGTNGLETQLQSPGIDRNFQFLLPFLRINYKITPTKSFRFSYLTRSRAPQLSQLLTISNNINPNQSYIGNANLKPEYNHIFQVHYYNFNTSTQFSYNAGFSFNKTLNKIVNQTFINEDFISLNSPVNTNLYESFSFNGGISGIVQQVNLRYRLFWNTNFNHYDAFLNGEPSKIATEAYTFRFNFERAKKEKWDISVGMQYFLNLSSFEINTDFDQRSSNFYWFANGKLDISTSLLLETSYRIQRFNEVDFFDGRILHFVNASLKKSFNNGKWEAFILVNDLLNQNIGIQRSSTINSLNEQTYNTRQQYFMLGLSKKLGRKKVH